MKKMQNKSVGVTRGSVLFEFGLPSLPWIAYTLAQENGRFI